MKASTPTRTPRGSGAGRQRALGAVNAARARLAIVSEIRLLRDGLARIVTERTSYAAEALVPDGALPERLTRFGPKLVLIDAASIRLNVTPQVRAAVPSAVLLAVAVSENENDIIRCAQAGAIGFVSCDASVEDLLSAIDSTLAGEAWCSPRMAGLMCSRLSAATDARAIDQGSLTSRERQVLDLITNGRSNKEIATNLSIELSTVKNHVHNVLEKLGVKHRWQASEVVRRAPEYGSTK